MSAMYERERRCGARTWRADRAGLSAVARITEGTGEGKGGERGLSTVVAAGSARGTGDKLCVF